MATIFKLNMGGKKAMPAPRQPKTVVSHAQLLYGVDWHALDGIGSLPEQANALARKNKANLYAVFENSGRGTDSLTGLVKSKNTKQTSFPAASVFALSVKKPSALYVGPHPDGKNLVLIGLLQGMPSPSYDKVGTLSDILTVANEYSAYLTEGGPLYVHKALDKVDGASDAGIGLRTFLERHSNTLTLVDAMPGTELISESEIQTYAFQKAGLNSSLKIAAISFLALALCGIGYTAWSKYDEAQNAAAQKRAREALALKTYISARDAAFADKPTTVASLAGPVIWQYVSPVRAQRAQWNLSTITCTTSCDWVYTKKSDANFKGLLKTVSPSESVLMKLEKLDQSTLTEAIPGFKDVPKVDLTALVNQVPNATTPSNDLVVSFGTTAQLMQRAGLIVTLSAATPLGDPTPVLKLPAGQQATVRAGTWTLNGPSFTFVDAMRRMPGNATLSKVLFNMNKSGDTFEATGRYITK
jgi:hypothetical protein